MTNSHCGTCGDPFFEMDGTTFCPSCHGGPEGVEATVPDEHAGSEPGESDTAESDPGGTESPAETAQTADPESGISNGSGDLEVETPTDRGDEGGVGRAEQARDPRQREPEPRATGSATSANRAEPVPSETTPSETPPAPSQSGPRHSGGKSTQSAPSGTLEDARDALTRALERYAREAAATDDPRYAKECLEAAREAGETLRTLR